MRLSAVYFTLSGWVTFNEHHKCHQIPMSTDKISLLPSLDCSSHLYQRKLSRTWYGIQRWDSRFPMVPTLCTIRSPVTLWSTVVSSSHCTSLTGIVSLLFSWSKLRPLLIKRCLCFTVFFCLHFTALVLNNVKITPERVRLLVGETLILNCTGETTYNGRINFTWDFPKKRVSSEFTLNAVSLYV